MLYYVIVKFSPDGNLFVDGNKITISIKSPPERGKANAEIVKRLSSHFMVKPSQVRIVSGQKSKKKMVEIL